MRSQRQAAYGLIPDSVFFFGLLSISQLPLLEPTLPAGGMIPIFESNLIFRLQVKATGGEDAKSKNVVFTARR